MFPYALTRLFCMRQHRAHFSGQRVFADNLKKWLSDNVELLDLLKCQESSVCSPFLVDFAYLNIQGKSSKPKLSQVFIYLFFQD